ncbi:MAG: tetratricopeptide repeat protein [Gammaproteobacteria bacterium]|nr:tetratricopeptide repeat protein [Gammaproteobacteria bacterium]
MSQEALIFEVGTSGFSRYVVENSHKLPVLVEFMAVWSEPCILLADVVHDLAQEFAGQFVFAKVDIDEQQDLREQFNIQNVPTLLVFKDGEVVLTQEGQLQEAELRVLLKGVGVYRVSDELREQARDKHMAGDTPAAILLLTQAIQQDPGNTRVAMDMVQIFIDTGELEQAKGLFNKLPDSDKDSGMGKSLIGQLTFADLAAATEGIERLNEQLQQDKHNHDARFDLAMCLVHQHDYDGAMDQLFTILQAAPDYKDGAAREMIVTITNMLTPNDPEQAKVYRRRLSNLLSE